MRQDSEHPDVQKIKEACLKLGEHFDTVQIFATRHQSETEEKTGTMNCNYGIGNWFARYGFIVEWIKRQDYFTQDSVRKGDFE